MAPGFGILLVILFLAALSPLVLGFAIGCLFSRRWKAYAARIVISGLIGGTVILGIILGLVKVLTGRPFGGGVELVAMYGAGFSLFGVGAAITKFLKERRLES